LEIRNKIFTVEEYFEFEQNSETRHEFVEGKIIKIPQKSKKSNRIAGRLCVYFLELLNEQIFLPYLKTIKLCTVRGNRFRYPDVMIVPVIDDEDDYIVYQPILIAEVLSPSTEKTDRNEKLKEYSKIPSVQYYLLVSQEESIIELYPRNGDIFEYTFFTEKTDIVNLPFFDIKLTLDDIYKNIL
jgi:Uma2 family endonuclease